MNRLKKIIGVILLVTFLSGYGLSANAQGIVANGNVEIKSYGNVHLVLNGESTVFTTDGNSSFSQESNSHIHVEMNVLDDGNLPNISNGTIHLEGTSTQNINTPYSFRNMVIENGSNIKINALVNVTGQIELNEGKIVVDNGGNYLHIPELLPIKGITNNNYVVGELGIKTDNLATTRSLFYPIGTLADYRPMSARFKTDTPGEILYSAKVFDDNNLNYSNANNLAKVSPEVYWRLEGNKQENTSEPSLTLRMNDNDDIDENMAAIVKDINTVWTSIDGTVEGLPGERNINATGTFDIVGIYSIGEILENFVDYDVSIPSLVEAPHSEATITFANLSQINPNSVKMWSLNLRAECCAGAVDLIADGASYTGLIKSDSTKNIGTKVYFSFETSGGQEVISNSQTAYLKVNNGDLVYPSLRNGETANDYQIISVPLDLDNNTLGDTFEELGAVDKFAWRMFHYNATAGVDEELFTADVLERNIGYWLIIKDQKSLALGAGSTTLVNDELIRIDLVPGLNQIGNPYLFDIDWVDVLNHNGICDNIELMGYRNREVGNITTLNQYEGAFVNVSEAMTLEIPVKFEVAEPSTCRIIRWPIVSAIDESAWWVNLRLKNNQQSNRLAGFGMHPGAEEGSDDFDQNIFPRFAGHIDATFDGPDGNITREIVTTANQYVWNFTINSSLTDPYTTIEWDNSYFGDNEKELFLYDVANQRMVDMRIQNNYPVNMNTSREFKVIYGSIHDVENLIVPEKTLIGDVYPNPSSRYIHIPFSIPTSPDGSHVIMEVYDLQGRKIQTLTNKVYSSGFYDMLFELGSESRNIVADQLLLIKSTIQTGEKSTVKLEKLLAN